MEITPRPQLQLQPIRPSLIATLATGPAIEDLRILLGSLTIFNQSGGDLPTVYLYCDSAIAAQVSKIRYPGRIVFKKALDAYKGLSRKEMEGMPPVKGVADSGKSSPYPNLWFQFMAEKLNLLDWVFSAETHLAAKVGVLFCDADICFLAPLPSIPTGTILALSPHMIRPSDEARYGAFNGGFLWFSNPRLVGLWRKAAIKDQRFFEQACLELLATDIRGCFGKSALYEFPITQNYGWWRMWQGREPAEKLMYEWTMNRMKMESASGILVSGEPLGSIHTHFVGASSTDFITNQYNEWVIAWLKRLAPGHLPAKRILGLILSAKEN